MRKENEMKSAKKIKLTYICWQRFGEASRFAGMTVKQFCEFARAYWDAVRKANGQAENENEQ